ncbi:hypothetical protein [Psychroflexus gondwanensis]|uniref:hypothetical protein n=1 Tax=Psychroflexus gondwanensis TaxID=251 RepID=UPI0016806119|nr:hypothetical protein [Psychroflexus gondwanensis]
MKIKTKTIFQILLVLALPVVIYFTKTDYYKNTVDFYKNDVNGIILKIKESRGTKVYYNESEFFYLDQLKDKSIKVGDSISKRGSDLLVFEKNSNGQYEFLKKINVIKPKDSYLKFFYGL